MCDAIIVSDHDQTVGRSLVRKGQWATCASGRSVLLLVSKLRPKIYSSASQCNVMQSISVTGNTEVYHHDGTSHNNVNIL